MIDSDSSEMGNIDVEVITLTDAIHYLQEFPDNEDEIKEEVLTVDDVGVLNRSTNTSPSVSDCSSKLPTANAQIPLMTVSEIEGVKNLKSVTVIQLSQPLHFYSQSFETVPEIPQFTDLKLKVKACDDENLNGEEQQSPDSCRNGITGTEFKEQKKKRKFACSLCGHKFITYDNYIYHVKHFDHNNFFYCSLCSYKTRKKTCLQCHIRTHTGEKPYACTVCPLRFAEKTSLNYHKRIHSGVKSYECSICDRKFYRKYHLNRHNRGHLSKTPFACPYCEYKTHEKDNLHKHMQKHNEGTFECYHCKRKFSQKPLLTQHIKWHVNKNPFSCSVCGCMFRTETNLKLHFRVHIKGKTVQ